MSEQAQCWINGRLMPGSEATVSVFDHGLLYGDGVFEGIRFYQGRAFRLHAHLKRLMDSAAAICLTIPYTQEELTQAVADIVAAFAEPEGYLRLMVTRGVGPLGLNPDSCTQPTVILIADHLSMISEKQRQRGAKLVIASTRRLPADGLDGRIKSLNYLNNILARMEANQAGADEAVLLNRNGHVAEGSAANIFIVRDAQLFTPHPVDGALQGITRSVVMELAASEKIPATVCALTAYDLYTADECFLTGTGAELIPVREVDSRPLRHCPGPVFSRLAEAFTNVIYRETGEK
ncbi:MAG: branched-chain-amino-acid transaminase [Gammaproteobacteria bacterium]|nr:branched-chain-amino-acid transaminase [Gammaproteobacteria bacterium]MCF6261621.1 branched-chain-amino-acid transaminase [Gammaproteobacteria bacterium]